MRCQVVQLCFCRCRIVKVRHWQPQRDADCGEQNIEVTPSGAAEVCIFLFWAGRTENSQRFDMKRCDFEHSGRFGVNLASEYS